MTLHEFLNKCDDFHDDMSLIYFNIYHNSKLIETIYTTELLTSTPNYYIASFNYNITQNRYEISVYM